MKKEEEEEEVSLFLNKSSPDGKSIKYLGLNDDNHLLFDNHINCFLCSWHYDDNKALYSLRNTKTNLLCLHSFFS